MTGRAAAIDQGGACLLAKSPPLLEMRIAETAAALRLATSLDRAGLDRMAHGLRVEPDDA